MNIGSVQAAKGAYGRAIYKFGFNAAISTTEETVWDGGGKYSYVSTAGSVSVVSSDAADDIDGTGAQKITIQGLDANWLPKTLEVDMDGTSSITVASTFIRVYRAIVSQAGSGEVNAGDITLSIDGTTVAKISADMGQTLMAVYTVPAGFTGYITQWSFSSGASASNKYLDGRLIVRKNAGIIQTKARATVQNTAFLQDLPKATVVSEKDDIEVRAVTSSGTDAVSGTFTVLLKRN
jgi:hypothetical protein